jgi:hypothetical protein
MAGCAARLTPQDVLVSPIHASARHVHKGPGRNGTNVQPDPSIQTMADAYAKKQEHRQRETARQHDDDDEVVSE